MTRNSCSIASIIIAVVAGIRVPAPAWGDETLGVPRFARLMEKGVEIVRPEGSRWIPNTTDVESFAWDRDGASIVATTRSALVRISVDTGERTLLLGAPGDVRFPSVSSRTGAIAFSVPIAEKPPRWEIHLCERDGSKERRLCDGYDPSFHPDGRVLFEVHAPRTALMAISPNHPNPTPTPLFHDDAARYTVDCGPSGQIAWSQDRALYVTLGDTVTRVSPADPTYDRFASFSPDGEWILFFRSRGDEGDFTVIRNLTTGDERELAADPGRGLAAFAPPAPRLLEHFTQLSLRNRQTAPFSELSQLDATLDWPRSLWVERSADADKVLFLSGVTDLLPSEAVELMKFKGTDIFLPDLSDLDLECAAQLGKRRGVQLWLDGLETIDPPLLDALFPSGSTFASLRGLSRIGPAIAKHLAAIDGPLFLDGVEHLDAATAEALANWCGNGEQYVLSLAGLKTIDPTVAARLARSRGWGLSLSGLTQLSPEVANHLAAWNGAQLGLNGVQSLTAEDVDRLLRFRAKWIDLRGLHRIDPAEQARLARSELPLFRLPTLPR